MAQESGDRPYRQLAKVFAGHPIGAPETDTFIEILKFYFEPEEAHLAAHMGFDLEPEEVIAGRAGVSLDDASHLLTGMASKFFTRGVRRPDGVRVFRLPLVIPGLFELPFVVRQPSPDLERLGKLWEKYFAEGWGQEIHGGSIQVLRTLPGVSVPKDQVIPHDDAVGLVERASSLMLIPCACRVAERNCDDPINVCILMGEGIQGGHVEGEPVLDPSRMVSTPRMRPTSVDEVVDVLKLSERAGLVHTTMNFQEDPWLICNCCRHACVGLKGITQLDIPHAVAPSAYWATVDEDLCNGCGACMKRCQVDAIRIRDDDVAEVDYERCLGCGICTFVCAPEALRLSLRDDRVFVPAPDEHEFFVMLGAARGRPYPAHQHPQV
ncbi:MAG: 4Fe-4S dicluster-binding protein [Dehalococcoidia bacterium]